MLYVSWPAQEPAGRVHLSPWIHGMFMAVPWIAKAGLDGQAYAGCLRSSAARQQTERTANPPIHSIQENAMSAAYIHARALAVLAR